ncbi:MAG: NAD(P)-dependent alcohol dehydrogenase [Gammaproteobacteria bacterium]|nr:NAD(P)-dependent alcohol dehydrogenase [Gammaproteobacteria bacterium]MDH5303858.1 NAD(P)-dependent alcohol dehydrogenase [Gammaproteobacteria bacterium]MDH5321461.1 NAD(P)-dependent alcohol dehydrogenase [Gammaproteobacteria bacterium]
MKLPQKILTGLAAFVVLATAALALTISYTSDCGAAAAVDEGDERFQAIQFRCYGPPEVLELTLLAKPVPKDDEVLVRVKAASLNPLDWHYMRGSPYLIRLTTGLGAPDNQRLGADFAGVIEAVGANVSRFKVGDAVFGTTRGSFAAYVIKHQDGSLAIMPKGASFAEAAALPVAGITALQALRDHGKLQSGQHVLINGASGGVGTYAVQIAKANGATVTGVSSERNHEMLKSLGADYVIDYRQTNYTDGDARYDLIVDMIGNHPLTANLDVLQAGGRLVIVGGEKGDWIGPISNMIKQPLLSPFVDHEIIVMLAQSSGDELAALAKMMESGEIESVIDRSYALSELPAAMAYLEEGHARGKVVVEIE